MFFIFKIYKQMNLLIKSIIDSIDYQLVMQKMKKTCKFIYA